MARMRAGSLLLGLALLGCASTSDAPPIFQPQLNNWSANDFLGVSVRFSRALKQQFPPGSSEGALRDILQSQGFRFLSATSAVYGWHDIVCTRKLSIIWLADDRQRIAQVEGSYYGTCL